MTETQQVILAIYKHVSSICRKHHIPFYAIGGTCIGAIRHNGFIPWDDDLDIAVPIEFWDNLIATLENELPEDLYLYHSDNIVSYHYIWLKVCNKNTTFIEKSEYNLENAYKGVFIDIMPISGVPFDNQNGFIRKLRRISRNNDFMRFPGLYTTPKARLYDLLFKLIRKLLSFNYFSNKYILELKKYPLKEAKQTGYVWHAEWMPRLIFPIDYFKETIEHQFEDTTIFVPKEYDKYLSLQFGDYMKLPPEDKRETHNGLVDINNSFSTYFGVNLKQN